MSVRPPSRWKHKFSFKRGEVAVVWEEDAQVRIVGRMFRSGEAFYKVEPLGKPTKRTGYRDRELRRSIMPAALPTIVVGGQEFYDISGIVKSDASMGGTRPTTDGIAIHHTVGQTEFPDRNANGTTLDEIVAHIKAIDEFHVQQGYGGFGYNGIVFRDGTACLVGRAMGKRAHVAYENWHLAGFAMAGNFEDNEVPLGITLGMARILAAMEKEIGTTMVKDHNSWVAPEHRPQWSTACCGRYGRLAIPAMLLAKNAIIRQDQAALEAAIREKITRALMPHVMNADLEAIANSVRWITGGKLCG